MLACVHCIVFVSFRALCQFYWQEDSWNWQWSRVCCIPNCVLTSLYVRKQLQVLEEVTILVHEWKSPFISVSREQENVI